jgi:hypothetical protein
MRTKDFERSLTCDSRGRGSLESRRKGNKMHKLWAVMKRYSWDCVTVQGTELRSPKDGPHFFIPLFETREQAVKWADGNDERIYEVTVADEKKGA